MPPAPGFGVRNRMAADVSGGREALAERLEARSHRFFKNMRRLRRGFEREHGEPVFTWDDRAPGVLDWIIAHKRDQYRRSRRHDVFACGWTADLLHDLSETRTADFGLRIASLRTAAGELAAAEASLDDGRILHLWFPTYAPAFARHGVGTLLTRLELEQAAASGYRLVDFGSGDESYKAVMAEPSGTVFEGVAEGPRPDLARMAGRILARGPARCAASSRASAVASTSSAPARPGPPTGGPARRERPWRPRARAWEPPHDRPTDSGARRRQRTAFGRTPMTYAHRLLETGLFDDDQLARQLERHPAELFDINLFNYDADDQILLQTGTKGRRGGVALLEAAKAGPGVDPDAPHPGASPDMAEAMRRVFADLADHMPGFRPVQVTGQLILSAPSARVPSAPMRQACRCSTCAARSGCGSIRSTRPTSRAARWRTSSWSSRPRICPIAARWTRRPRVFDLKPGMAIAWPQHAPHRIENQDSFNVSLSCDYLTWGARLTNGAHSPTACCAAGACRWLPPAGPDGRPRHAVGGLPAAPVGAGADAAAVLRTRLRTGRRPAAAGQGSDHPAGDALRRFLTTRS